MLSLGALNDASCRLLDSVAQNVSGRIIKLSPNTVGTGVASPYNYTIRMLFPKTTANTTAPASFTGKTLSSSMDVIFLGQVRVSI